MAKVRELIHGIGRRIHAYPPRGPLIDTTPLGVEIEVEGTPGYIMHMAPDYWKCVRDGSLRDGGVEFVFREPLSGVEVLSALDELTKVMRNINAEHNIRTSMHVHVDVRNMELADLYKMLLLNCIFEGAISDYCGEERKHNVFCVEIKHSAMAQALIAGLDNEDRFVEWKLPLLHQQDAYRYMAVNLCSLVKYGSVEYRSHPSTLSKGRILRWINMLLSMKRYAETYNDTPEEMVNSARMSSPFQLMYEVFGRLSKYLNITEEAMDEGFLVTNGILHNHVLAEVDRRAREEYDEEEEEGYDEEEHEFDEDDYDEEPF